MTEKDKKAIIKLLIGIMIQIIGYFCVKYTPISPYLIDDKLDQMIPFIPHFVYFYILWYIFIPLIPLLIYKKDEKVFHKYIKAYISSLLTCFIIYFIFPTTINRAVINSKDLSSYLLSILYKIDQPVLNCLPSMHCFLCFIQMFYIGKCKNMKKGWKALLFGLEILIISSTLLIKQHQVIDGISAFVLTGIICFSVEMIDKKKEK